VIPSAAATHHSARHGACVASILILAITIVGCTAGPSANPSPTSTGTEAAAASVAPSLTGRPPCPVSYHGDCLGPIPAGTYTTVQFQPTLTYTVPAPGGSAAPVPYGGSVGWLNSEDLPGLFTLIPPGFRLGGPDGNEPAGDYIGIYTSVVAANADCTESEQPGVGHITAALAAEFTHRAGLTTTTPTPVSVGGLQGVVLDIRLADGWTQTCFYSQGSPVVPLIRGVGPSSVDNPIGPGIMVRLYLLDLPDSTLAIQLWDTSGGTHLDAYSAIVDQLRFGS
jgi:hypothetical protein